jgi:AcrR family transcriptional regulator
MVRAKYIILMTRMPEPLYALLPRYGRDMARLKSAAKRTAILRAAVREIAQSGLGAPTAQIAQRAGVAAGTLFTYFATKEQLLNELYVALKSEAYARINAKFPGKGRQDEHEIQPARKAGTAAVGSVSRHDDPGRRVGIAIVDG